MPKYRVARRGVTSAQTEVVADGFHSEGNMVIFTVQGRPIAALPVDNVAYVAELNENGDIPFTIS